MTTPWIFEAIGYTASVLVALSVTMRSLLKLRLINLAGSSCFAVYGALIQAYPVLVLNLFIMCINVYYLRELLAVRVELDYLEVTESSPYLRHFLGHHAREIQRFMPGFTLQPHPHQHIYFMLRNMKTAGLFIADAGGSPCEDGALWVRLDFVTPEYRDYRIGYFVYQHMVKRFRDRGIHTLYSEIHSSDHARYLRRMGFVPAPGSSAHYMLRLEPAHPGGQPQAAPPA